MLEQDLQPLGHRRLVVDGEDPLLSFETHVVRQCSRNRAIESIHETSTVSCLNSLHLPGLTVRLDRAIIGARCQMPRHAVQSRRLVTPAPTCGNDSVCERCGAEMYRMHAVWRCPAAASRPTAADGHACVLDSHVDPSRLRRSRPTASGCSSSSPSCASASTRAREGGGPRSTSQRHREQGKLPVRERIDRLLDPGSPFLELSPLAAHRTCTTTRRPRAGLVTGIGRVSGREVLIVANDATVKGGTYYPDHREEARARAADRAREPAAVRLPRRFGRRVPAAAGRGLPRPRALRPDLLQPGAHVGRAHPADRRRHGLVHGRRRLRAGDVGRNDHRQGHRHDLSSAARRS